MRFIQGGAGNPAIINGGPNPGVNAPALGMSAAWFSNPISLFSGFTAPDLTVIQVSFTATASPTGVLFLQGSISTFGPVLPQTGTQGGPAATDWFTLPNPFVPISGGVQQINGVNLPLQAAVFRLFSPAPGVLFVRVGYAPTSGGSGDTASVYALAVAN